MRKALINVKYYSLILLLSLFLFSCSKYKEGEVRDNFGKPVNGVMVSIENSNFKSFTDPNGNYKLDYVPGELSSSLVQKEVVKPESLWVIVVHICKPKTHHFLLTSKSFFTYLNSP